MQGMKKMVKVIRYLSLLSYVVCEVLVVGFYEPLSFLI
jgi:hypothetical protein